MSSRDPAIPDPGASAPLTGHRLETLLPAVYEQLHDVARVLMQRERPGHTLQPTALVNEAYLRLSRQAGSHWRNREQFLAVAAQAMRRILVDSARRRRAAKRGDGREPIPLHEALAPTTEFPADVLALDDALRELADVDPRAAQLVELRFFAGLSMEEAAQVLGLSLSTTEREWRAARAWLYRAMTARDGME